MRNPEIAALVERLRALRQERNLSLSGMAQMLNVSPSHLSMVFHGSRDPGLRFVQAALKRFPELRSTLAPAKRK